MFHALDPSRGRRPSSLMFGRARRLLRNKLIRPVPCDLSFLLGEEGLICRNKSLVSLLPALPLPPLPALPEPCVCEGVRSFLRPEVERPESELAPIIIFLLFASRDSWDVLCRRMLTFFSSTAGVGEPGMRVGKRGRIQRECTDSIRSHLSEIASRYQRLTFLLESGNASLATLLVRKLSLLLLELHLNALPPPSGWCRISSRSSSCATIPRREVVEVGEGERVHCCKCRGLALLLPPCPFWLHAWRLPWRELNGQLQGLFLSLVLALRTPLALFR